uniref:Uncharacterized protein n=1 Tax=Oryza meridionalis TaxID=40149 RepID=A0A0E0CNK2_9ORYZ
MRLHRTIETQRAPEDNTGDHHIPNRREEAEAIHIRAIGHEDIHLTDIHEAPKMKVAGGPCTTQSCWLDFRRSTVVVVEGHRHRCLLREGSQREEHPLKIVAMASHINPSRVTCK